MPDFRTLDGVNVSGQRVLIRVDLNVPMENGRVTDMTRISRVAPTIAELADKGAKVVVLSHFGRPGGKPVPEMSLRPLVEPLAAALKRPVSFAEDCVGIKAKQVVELMKAGDIVLLENLRWISMRAMTQRDGVCLEDDRTEDQVHFTAAGYARIVREIRKAAGMPARR